MKSERTIKVERRGGKYVEILPDGTTRPLEGKTDWASFDALTDEDIHKAALADPDNPPLTKTELARMRRVSPVKQLRWKLGLSQTEFAERFRLPVGTIRDWEQRRSEPDQAAKNYLKIIAADAAFVERTLAAA
jgi:putative transcriptional regulator